jgi:hypothetical protein
MSDRRPMTVNGKYISGPDCAICGYKAVNVRHEQDPNNAPEGIEYYRPFLNELHEFVPVGEKP